MLIEMRDMALNILELSWPIIVIVSIIATTLRIAYIVINHKQFILYQELFKLFFLIYILCLYQVVTYQDVTWSSANYVPFKEIFRYSVTDYLFYKNVLGNVILFAPLGFFIKYYVGAKKVYQVTILSLIVSIAIELTQLVIGRVFDIDDIILNMFGAIIGYLIAKIFIKIKDSLPSFLKKDIVLNIIAILFVGGIICFLIP